jgi:hypothetical protein
MFGKEKILMEMEKLKRAEEIILDAISRDDLTILEAQIMVYDLLNVADLLVRLEEVLKTLKKDTNEQKTFKKMRRNDDND